jgi:hypothetical protein
LENQREDIAELLLRFRRNEIVISVGIFRISFPIVAIVVSGAGVVAVVIQGVAAGHNGHQLPGGDVRGGIAFGAEGDGEDSNPGIQCR